MTAYIKIKDPAELEKIMQALRSGALEPTSEVLERIGELTNTNAILRSYNPTTRDMDIELVPEARKGVILIPTMRGKTIIAEYK